LDGEKERARVPVRLFSASVSSVVRYGAIGGRGRGIGGRKGF